MDISVPTEVYFVLIRTDVSDHLMMSLLHWRVTHSAACLYCSMWYSTELKMNKESRILLTLQNSINLSEHRS